MKRALITLAIIFASISALMAADQISTSQSGMVIAPPAAIWALLADVNHWADWCPAVEKAQIVKGDGQTPNSQVKFRPVIGGKKTPTAIKLVLSKSEPNRLLEYRGGPAGMDITLGWKIEEKDGGSEFTSYETISGPGVKLFLKLYGQSGLDQEHRAWVEAARKKLESGK
ncbi:MAG TPA: SRPBCC family protein [bacterium]|nr:SRPBCC family protein [bacterium]